MCQVFGVCMRVVVCVTVLFVVCVRHSGFKGGHVLGMYASWGGMGVRSINAWGVNADAVARS